MVSKTKRVDKRKKVGSIDLIGQRFLGYPTGDCCHCLCNKRGLFTEIDMAFDNFMTLGVPNSNVACRCCCPGRIPKRPIFQGRSCACLIRPRQRYRGSSYAGRGCSPERCGCNNHISEDFFQ